MLAAVASSSLAVDTPIGAARLTEPSQLPLPPSDRRPWRLPGLPAAGAIVRVFECQYAHIRTHFDGLQGTAPGENHTSADSRLPRLHGCVSDEMSRWYHSVPASLVRPDADSLWYSYQDVLQADGQPQAATPAEMFPSSRVMGFLLSTDVLVDAAFPHDAWSTQAQLDYPMCAANFTSKAYAQIRLAELQERCKSTARTSREKNLTHLDAYTQYHLWKTGHFGNWVKFGKQTCFRPTVAQAEADQRAYLQLLSTGERPTCETGPLYNQLQVRYNVRQITGIFFTPELRKEAEMARKAVLALSEAFGQQHNLTMIEAVRTPDYPIRSQQPSPTRRKFRLRTAAMRRTLLPASESVISREA